MVNPLYIYKVNKYDIVFRLKVILQPLFMGVFEMFPPQKDGLCNFK